MTIQMFDTTTPDEVPTGNVQAVAGYVGGHWPTYARLAQDHPQAHHLSIAVNAHEDAECLDVEAGDATPDEAPAWVKRQQGRGVQRPVLYASVSAMAAVLAALARAGIDRSQVRLWTAHYTGHAHLCTARCGFGFRWTADATQWTDRALGRNLDESVCIDSFFGPPPPPSDPQHYASYPHGSVPVAQSGDRIRRGAQRTSDRPGVRPPPGAPADAGRAAERAARVPHVPA